MSKKDKVSNIAIAENGDKDKVSLFSFDLRDLPHNTLKKFINLKSACAIVISNLTGILNSDLVFYIKREKEFIALKIDRQPSETFLIIPYSGDIGFKPIKENTGIISFNFKVIYF